MTPQRGIEGLSRPVFMGIDLWPGDRAIETAAFALADDPTGPLRLRKLLARLDGYDVVFLDTPPSLGFALHSAILAAGTAILPTLLVQQDLDALADALELRDRLSELGGAAERIVIVPHAYRIDGNDRQTLAVLGQVCGDRVAAPIPLTVSIKYALNARKPVSLYEPGGAAALAYRALADRVLAEASHHG